MHVIGLLNIAPLKKKQWLFKFWCERVSVCKECVRTERIVLSQLGYIISHLSVIFYKGHVAINPGKKIKLDVKESVLEFKIIGFF